MNKENNVKQENKKQVNRPHKQKLQELIEKLNHEDKRYTQQFNQLQAKFKQESQQIIQNYLAKTKLKFQKTKRNLEKQLLTLKFYSQHPQQKINIFPLFNQIEEKLAYNDNIIASTQLKIVLPTPNKPHIEQEISQIKLTLYENYLRQLLELFKNQNIKKYCKKQVQSCNRIKATYTNLFQKAKESIYSSDVKIKNNFQQGLSQLTQYRHVQKLTLSLTTNNGILYPEHYHEIINSLLPNRSFLQNLTLKIMDMQFNQYKCDIFRKRISNQLKQLKSLVVQNYYTQCKLGQFEDYTWHPYRKQINIFGGVW